ncbi:helix-turn-helix domain-containing protein [Embleya sp. NPDC059237]|uniref:helix-turn-helix domain-containing protein n=1 Tax=Embleya sp. NPDC059237 TaxID=3346784 RepID=UPI0036A7628C
MAGVRQQRQRPGSGMRVRQARLARAWTPAELGRRAGYSAAQVSRYERGLAPLTDVTVIRRFAHALELSVEDFGLAPTPPLPGARPATHGPFPGLPGSTVVRENPREGERVRRRRLLADLAATASLPLVGAGPAGARTPVSGDVLVARVRDAMLGLDAAPPTTTTARVRGALAVAMGDYHAGRYGALAERLPCLVAAGHALADDSASAEHQALLAEVHVLTTRMLIKLDDVQLGWMAADRARATAHAGNSHSSPRRPPGTWPFSPARPGGTNRPCASLSTPPTTPPSRAPPRASPPNAVC